MVHLHILVSYEHPKFVHQYSPALGVEGLASGGVLYNQVISRQWPGFVRLNTGRMNNQTLLLFVRLLLV
jgi:hypothetical protein